MSDQQLDDEPIVMASHWVPPTINPWGNILRPMTIFQVQEEHSPSSEDESSNGMAEKKSFAIALVAHVIRVEINPATASCVLEDGTGRIVADKELDSLTHQFGLSSEAVEEEISQFKAFEHTYVEVIGIKYSKWKPRIKIRSIHPVHGYNHVMYHILNVIHSQMLDQSHDCDSNLFPKEDDENMAVDDYVGIQYHIPTSHVVPSNIFSPQRHQPYATLQPLERAIMMHLHHCHRNQQVLIGELAKVVQESSGCTELQFNLAVEALLSEAYMTCPLDDEYVVITPRH